VTFVEAHRHTFGVALIPATGRPGLVSAYDLTCRLRYDLTCRSRHG
jgi:hypothetical protein